MKKSDYVGLSILGICKCQMDTHSFIIYIKTKYIYKETTKSDDTKFLHIRDQTGPLIIRGKK